MGQNSPPASLNSPPCCLIWGIIHPLCGAKENCHLTPARHPETIFLLQSNASPCIYFFPQGNAYPPNSLKSSPACKSFPSLSEQLFLTREQKGGGGSLARPHMFAICTMLSSVNTVANERAATHSPVAAARSRRRINWERKTRCTQGLCVRGVVFGHWG